MTCLIHMCDIMHVYTWHASFIYATWHMRTCDMPHSYVWHNACIHVTCHIHMRDMTQVYIWYASYICVTRRMYTCDMPHSYVWHHACMYTMDCPIYMCNRCICGGWPVEPFFRNCHVWRGTAIWTFWLMVRPHSGLILFIKIESCHMDAWCLSCVPFGLLGFWLVHRFMWMSHVPHVNVSGVLLYMCVYVYIYIHIYVLYIHIYIYEYMYT